MHQARRGWLRRLWVGLVCSTVVSTVVVMTPSPAAAVRACSAGLVVLTFDDGPSPTQTPRLVRILRQHRVPATFFMVGQRVRSAPAIARMVQRNGFQVENHTWSHPLLTRISDRAISDQLLATAREMRRHGLRPGRVMRPPYGGIDARVRRAIDRTRLVPVLWDVDSQDWAGGDARRIADRILAQLRPHRRNVVLQHDGVTNSPNSISAVPLVVAEARRRGYCFTDLNDLGLPRVPRPQVRAQVTNGSEIGDVNGTTPVRVLLTLDRPTTRAVSFRFRTVSLSATADKDFLRVVERVEFAPGTTRRAVRIRVLPDREPEGWESFRLLLDAATGVDFPRTQYLARIADDDREGAAVPASPEPTPVSAAAPAPGAAATPPPVSASASWLLRFDPWYALR